MPIAPAAMPPERPQAGNGKGYFEILGNERGRWHLVAGGWNGSSKSGQWYRRLIPRLTNDEDEDALAAHAGYWMEEWFRARNLCPKLSLASKDVIHPRLRVQMPARTMFYKMIRRKRPPPPTTPNPRWYFHGTSPPPT